MVFAFLVWNRVWLHIYGYIYSVSSLKTKNNIFWSAIGSGFWEPRRNEMVMMNHWLLCMWWLWKKPVVFVGNSVSRVIAFRELDFYFFHWAWSSLVTIVIQKCSGLSEKELDLDWGLDTGLIPKRLGGGVGPLYIGFTERREKERMQWESTWNTEKKTLSSS